MVTTNKQKKHQLKMALKKSHFLAGVAVASFAVNTELDNIVRADDYSQESGLLVEQSEEVLSEVAPATIVAETILEPSVIEEPLTPIDHAPPAFVPLETTVDGAKNQENSLSESEPVPEELVLPAVSDTPLVEEVVPSAQETEDSIIKEEETNTEWQFQGLGNRDFARVTYEEEAGQLNLHTEGRPHVYFDNRLYASVTVSRDQELAFSQEWIGSETYQSSAVFYLQSGDQLKFYHAEPERLIISNDALKASSLSREELVYLVQDDLKLRNITDLVVLSQEISALYVDNEKSKLALGVTEVDLLALEEKIANQLLRLTEQDRLQLEQELEPARQLMANIAWDIPLNHTFTQSIKVLGTTFISGTEREGRPVGTKHDRQDLGLILQEGSELRVRQINPEFKEGLTFRLFGNDGRTENETVVYSDWVSLTALADVVAFIDTPISDDDSHPTIEFEVVSGAAKTLPVYTYGDNQASFIEQWDNSKASYGLLKTHNIHFLVPIGDLPHLAGMTIEQLLIDYDEKAFPLLDGLTGLPSNTADSHHKGIYFAKVNKTGAGLAYYARTHTAHSSESLESYFSLGWLPIHEIAHGYEVPSETMSIVDVFNNIYGALFQAKYMDNPTRDSWVYDGQKSIVVDRILQSLNNDATFETIGLRDRLVLLLNLVTIRGEEGFSAFNSYHRQQAVAGNDFRDLGSLWTEFFAQTYQLDVVPFFEALSIPLKEATLSNIQEQSLTPLALLSQLVPADRLDWAVETLGWSDQFLQTKLSLVSNADIALLGLTSRVSLTIDNPQDLVGSRLFLMDGDQIIQTILVTEEAIDLGELPNGIYYLKHEDKLTKIDSPYLLVKEDMQTTRQFSRDHVLSFVDSLYVDKQYEQVLPTVQLADLSGLKSRIEEVKNETIRQLNLELLERAYELITEWQLKGLGDYQFARLRYPNHAYQLYLEHFGVLPHAYIDDVYTAVTVTDDTGQVVYRLDYIGTESVAKGVDEVTLGVGYEVIIYHKEASHRLEVHASTLNTNQLMTTVYRVLDDGRLQLVPVSPSAQSAESEGMQAQQLTLEVASLFSSGHDRVPLEPNSLAILNQLGKPVKQLSVDGQGQYQISEGQIIFIPEPEFVGSAAVSLVMTDVNGQLAETTYTIIVLAPTTTFVTTSGELLAEVMTGQQAALDFEHYYLIASSEDERGNREYRYQPILTHDVTETGEALGESRLGQLASRYFEGFEWLSSVTDAYGNVTHTYKPVEMILEDMSSQELPVEEPLLDAEQLADDVEVEVQEELPIVDERVEQIIEESEELVGEEAIQERPITDELTTDESVTSLTEEELSTPLLGKQEVVEEINEGESVVEEVVVAAPTIEKVEEESKSSASLSLILPVTVVTVVHDLPAKTQNIDQELTLKPVTVKEEETIVHLQPVELVESQLEFVQPAPSVRPSTEISLEFSEMLPEDEEASVTISDQQEFADMNLSDREDNQEELLEPSPVDSQDSPIVSELESISESEELSEKANEQGEIVVYYLDQSGQILAPMTKLVSALGSAYHISAKTIPGYRLIQAPSNASGIMRDKLLEIVYAYEKISTSQLVITYVDEFGSALLPAKTLVGRLGEDYISLPKSIPGYQLTALPVNAKGVFVEENAQVTYIYQRQLPVMVELEQELLPQVREEDEVAVPEVLGNHDSDGVSEVSISHQVKVPENSSQPAIPVVPIIPLPLVVAESVSQPSTGVYPLALPILDREELNIEQVSQSLVASFTYPLNFLSLTEAPNLGDSTAIPDPVISSSSVEEAAKQETRVLEQKPSAQPQQASAKTEVKPTSKSSAIWQYVLAGVVFLLALMGWSRRKSGDG